jgi:hypothetical protein
MITEENINDDEIKKTDRGREGEREKERDEENRERERGNEERRRQSQIEKQRRRLYNFQRASDGLEGTRDVLFLIPFFATSSHDHFRGIINDIIKFLLYFYYSATFG